MSTAESIILVLAAYGAVELFVNIVTTIRKLAS